jgi:hypothetical protein
VNNWLDAEGMTMRQPGVGNEAPPSPLTVASAAGGSRDLRDPSSGRRGTPAESFGKAAAAAPPGQDPAVSDQQQIMTGRNSPVKDLLPLPPTCAAAAGASNPPGSKLQPPEVKIHPPEVSTAHNSAIFVRSAEAGDQPTTEVRKLEESRLSGMEHEHHRADVDVEPPCGLISYPAAASQPPDQRSSSAEVILNPLPNFPKANLFYAFIQSTFFCLFLNV